MVEPALNVLGSGLRVREAAGGGRRPAWLGGLRRRRDVLLCGARQGDQEKKDASLHVLFLSTVKPRFAGHCKDCSTRDRRSTHVVKCKVNLGEIDHKRTVFLSFILHH